MPETSLEAWMKIRPVIGDMHWALLQFYCYHRNGNPRFPPPWTGNELNYLAKNIGAGVQPHKRLREMVAGSMLICLPKRRCRVTGQNASEWELVDKVPPAEIAALARKMQLDRAASLRTRLTWLVNHLAILKTRCLDGCVDARITAMVQDAINYLEKGEH